MTDTVTVQRHDSCGRPGIELKGISVGVVVGEVAAHDQDRFRAAPQPVYDCCHLVSGRLADEQRNEFEVVQHGLEEREVDFQAVFVSVGVVVDRDVIQIREGVGSSGVERDSAQRSHP